MPTRDDAFSTDELLLLWTARRTGVLEALMRSAGTAREVATDAAVSERVARLTIHGLADAGFLRRVGGEYEPTNRALGFLATRDLRSIGRRPHELDRLDRLADGVPAADHAGDMEVRDDDATRNALGAHAATDEATVRACVTAASRAAPDAECVLDVGGGSGVYATEFVARGSRVTLVDDAARIETARQLLARTEVEGVAGDLARGELGGVDADYDLAFLAGVASRFEPGENQRLLSAVRGVARAVCVVDTFRDRSPAATPRTVVSALAEGRGDAYEVDTVERWLRDAGFEGVETRDVPGTTRSAVVGGR